IVSATVYLASELLAFANGCAAAGTAVAHTSPRTIKTRMGSPSTAVGRLKAAPPYVERAYCARSSHQPAREAIRLTRHGFLGRLSVRPTSAAKNACLRGRGDRDAGARHWRQHHDLLARADDAAAAAAVPESGPGRHGLGRQSGGGFRQKHTRSRQLPGLAL